MKRESQRTDPYRMSSRDSMTAVRCFMSRAPGRVAEWEVLMAISVAIAVVRVWQVKVRE